VASDVCAVLGLTVGSAMQNVDDDEKSKIPNKYLGSPGGHDSPVVSESGLYALILRSRKEEAKKFRKWVTGVVLPAIRRTGRYAPSREIPDFSDPAAAARAWADQYERRQIAEDKLEVAGPKAEFYDRVTSADNCVDVTAAAHILNLPGVGRNNLFKRLREEKMLRSDNEPYQIHVAAGRFRVIETETAAGVKRKTLITQKGLDYIRRVLG
jgi:phage antirepressor YoqD-like protein